MKNILIIVMDHVLFYKHDVFRPGYEYLKKKSICFANAYSVSPLCCPARRSILTGLYPHNHRQLDNGSKAPLNKETYYDALLKKGYKCEYYGKLHIGNGTIQDLKIDGFSMEGYGNPYKLKEYQKYLKENNLPPPLVKNKYSESEIKKYPENKIIDLTTIDNLYALCFGEFISPKECHEAFFLAKTINKRLEHFKKTQEPFCLRVDFFGPHQPYYPTKEYIDMYKNIKLYPSFHDNLKNKPACYFFDQGLNNSLNGKIITPNNISETRWKDMLRISYAENTLFDDALLSIVKKVEELKLDENTAIIFLADHGDALASHGGHIDKDSYLSEEVLRVPLLCYVPHIKPYIETKEVLNFDVSKTILSLADTDYSSSVDALSLLSNKKRDYIVCSTFGHFMKHHARAVIKNNYKYVFNDENMIDEFYNLNDDPYEMNNLIFDNKYSDIIQKYKEYLSTWEAKEGYKD